MKELFKALAEFQNEVPVIHQNTKGYNYTYADLHQIFEVIKPLLKKHGLGFTQCLEEDSLQTMVFHIESGERLESLVSIPKVNLKGQNEFQALGSGITYLRRYSLSCMLGLITDKDADAHGEQVKKKPNLVVNSKAFHGGLTKGTELEIMEEHFDITEEVATEYLKQLS
jgi:hypothetical protein